MWWAIIGLILLVPLGLLAPGGAFGEDSVEDIKKAFHFVPKGMAALAGHLHALLQDYGVPNSRFSADAPDLFHQSIGYYAAAVVGIAIVGGLTYLVSRLVAAREDGGRGNS